MAWLIVCFSDLTVSIVSEKWMRKNGKKCYFPKCNVAFHIKKESYVDKKSGNWAMHACRILMRGEKYSSLKEAKKAEKIAQNHSTMTSFENSYAAKQEARKHPEVYKDSSDGKSENGDFKNIEELKKLDCRSVPTSDKVYTYHRSEEADCNGSFEVSISSENDVVGSDDAIVESDDDMNGDDNEMNEEENVRVDDEVNDLDENSYEDDVNAPSNDASENALPPEYGINLESTSEVRSPAENYDFSDDRCLVRVEKSIMHVCRQLESIKHEIKSLKIKSSDTEQVVEKLVAVCKDLSVEVFTCTEELKKRNGMFTDLLVPDLKLTLKRRKHFKENELALANTKITDNMIKYLASTVNEKKEKKFIEGCFKAIFDAEFLTNTVWWKSEPGKVLFKKSRTLHCIRESFKMKFGLVEPRRNDKQIEGLIHKVCRNIKDSYRKSIKKAKQAEEKADRAAKKASKKSAKKLVESKSNGMVMSEADVQVERDDCDNANEVDLEDSENCKKHKKAKKAEKAKSVTEGAAKKASKKSATKLVESESNGMVMSEADVQVERDDCDNANDWDLEDYENYKKHKKAKKAAKKAEKAKSVAEGNFRATKNPNRVAEEVIRGVFDIGISSPKHGKKRLAARDNCVSKIVYKKHKKN